MRRRRLQRSWDGGWQEATVGSAPHTPPRAAEGGLRWLAFSSGYKVPYMCSMLSGVFQVLFHFYKS